MSSWISYRKKTTVLGTSRDRHDPLQRALEWLRQLETGEVASRAAIARREGVSRARVTRILNRLGAAMAARYGRREIVIFAIYDAGAHQVVWRKDEIAKQEAELAITGQDGAVAVLFALQKRLTDAGINPYISNYKPD